MASCNRCDNVVKRGVKCVKCKVSFHRGCEKLKVNQRGKNYVCTKCMQISDTDDSDCNTSVDSFFEASVANIAAENERLVIENKSLMEIIKCLQDDVAASEKTIALINNENIELKSQLDSTKDFSAVVRKRNSPP